jgi:flagellar L-ring protein precursor FlgH
MWNARQESLFQDIKAHRVGDIVTIMVSEQSKASKEAATSTSRVREYNGEGYFMGLSTPSQTILQPVNKTGYGLSLDNTFTGKGSTKKADSMTAYMTATVTDILPNGNLVIRGSRWTKVNDELQQIVLEGVVRPMDITRDNTVLSQNIAEAKIFFVGKGPVSRQQKPGLLGQIVDMIVPF